MLSKLKLTTKSASDRAETAVASQAGAPASAMSAPTQSQYCGEKTLLAAKKMQTRAQAAGRGSSRRVRSSTAASAAAPPSAAAAGLKVRLGAKARGSPPA